MNANLEYKNSVISTIASYSTSLAQDAEAILAPLLEEPPYESFWQRLAASKYLFLSHGIGKAVEVIAELGELIEVKFSDEQWKLIDYWMICISNLPDSKMNDDDYHKKNYLMNASEVAFHTAFMMQLPTCPIKIYFTSKAKEVFEFWAKMHWFSFTFLEETSGYVMYQLEMKK